jgi:hypothetical protein
VGLRESWDLANGRIRVAAAGPDEMTIVAGLLDEASAWLDSRGLTGWPRPYPAAMLEADLSRGETYLARDGETPAGTFSLYRTDPLFWGVPAGEPPGYARYLHKVATSRSHPGLGTELVALSERIALREGAAVLRLDCAAANPWIRRYYETAGFGYRGEIDVPSLAFRAALYEKPLR